MWSKHHKWKLSLGKHEKQTNKRKERVTLIKYRILFHFGSIKPTKYESETAAAQPLLLLKALTFHASLSSFMLRLIVMREFTSLGSLPSSSEIIITLTFTLQYLASRTLAKQFYHTRTREHGNTGNFILARWLADFWPLWRYRKLTLYSHPKLLLYWPK